MTMALTPRMARLIKTNLPAKCSACRDGGPCFDFIKTGECKYGNNCRFVHHSGVCSDGSEDESDISDSDSIDLDCY